MTEPIPRPDPDALLAQVQADEARERRGRLKIFFGASAGVGKTYAMLSAARSALADGTAVTIGVVETHGRPDTEALAQGLPRLALRPVVHRGHTLREFDLDAALAFGAQQAGALILLDEFAHSNAPGSRHPKRWQDAEELLAAGIDVWTTMNVQHLESLNDVVSGITGIRVWETVPDRLFDEADEVVVVDLPPDELLERLRSGKVYLPARDGTGDDQRAERAAANFFRKGNLLALRELALRRTADRVDDEVRAFRQRGAPRPVWANRESLLAGVGRGPNAEKVVRTAARLAAQLDVPWHALHVQPLSGGPDAGAQKALDLAESLGARVTTFSDRNPAAALVRHAREHNLSRLVLGRSRLRGWLGRGLADRVGAIAPDVEVLQVGQRGGDADETAARAAAATTTERRRWPGYLAAALACATTALLATPLIPLLELTNIVMIFLLVVVGIALRFGRGPAVLASFLGVALFDFFFVPPRFTFAVSDVEYLVTFAVMLVVGLAIGQLTAVLRQQADAATRRERRVRALHDMARDLSAALLPEQVAQIGARFAQSEFGARSALLVADEHDRLQAAGPGDAPVDLAVAQWAYERGEPAGRGTDTLPASPTLVVPLKAPMRVRGALVIEPAGARALDTEQRQALQAGAALLAISLERIHYIEVAQHSTVQIESERLRNSLLAAISHDLRTPLTALVGLADTLNLARPPLPTEQAEVATAIGQTARRMSTLVSNLLDMARLQAGAVPLQRAWQPLEEVVGSAVAASAGLLRGRPLEVALPDDLPLLHLDAALMERVLANLLENAAKYTPPGSALRIGAALDSEHVRLFVDDEGPGLPPGQEARVFEKFERGERESATPGVGLGLAICRAIVQAHGGRISGRNRERGGRIEGAHFEIELPRGTPPATPGEHSEPNAP
jgi:two-component system sensor histidine kinase KdpD